MIGEGQLVADEVEVLPGPGQPFPPGILAGGGEIRGICGLANLIAERPVLRIVPVAEGAMVAGPVERGFRRHEGPLAGVEQLGQDRRPGSARADDERTAIGDRGHVATSTPSGSPPRDRGTSSGTPGPGRTPGGAGPASGPPARDPSDPSGLADRTPVPRDDFPGCDEGRPTCGDPTGVAADGGRKAGSDPPFKDEDQSHPRLISDPHVSQSIPEPSSPPWARIVIDLLSRDRSPGRLLSHMLSARPQILDRKSSSLTMSYDAWL